MNSEERHRQRFLRRTEKRNIKKAERMKAIDDFNSVFTLQHLWDAQKSCCKNVGWKASTQRVKNHPITTVSILYRQLHAGKYKSKGFYEFQISERGKTRDIKSVHITERIVQKCLCENSLLPAFVPTLIYDNGACMKGKGIDFAMNRIKRHLHEYYRQSNSNEGYAIIMDFSSYFDTILHNKLKEMIDKRYKDVKIKNLYMHFVNMFGDVGLGLGSQISQISAIRYPNEMDYTIKCKMRMRQYARYNDDSYIISNSKEYLNCALKTIKDICNAYNIKLNPKKTRIVKLSNGVKYLKHRFVLTNTGKVLCFNSGENAKRMRRRLKAFARLISNGIIDKEYAKGSYCSWKAREEKSNSAYRIIKMDSIYKKLIGENLQ